MVVGALFGALYLWAFSPSVNDFFASLGAGGAAGSVFGLGMAIPGVRRKWQALGIAATAGAVGGLAWWLIAKPPIEAYWVAGIGAGSTVTLMVLAELGFNI